MGAPSAASSQLAVVELLLKERSAVNRKDTHGKTPLMNAIMHDHQAVIKALINAKATLGWDEATSASELCERAHKGRPAPE